MTNDTTPARKNDADLLALIAAFDQLHRDQPDNPDRKRATALWDQITGTVPATLGGVLAVLEFSDQVTDPLIATATAGLRAIAEKGDAAMSALDPFALGGRQEGDDAILALFREWQDEMERLAASDLSDDEYEPLCLALMKTERQIFDANSAGLTGLAIKAFMLGYEAQADEGLYHSGYHSCAINPFAPDQYGAERTLYLSNHALKGLIADAARLVPELAPLTARINASPVVLPPDGEGIDGKPDAEESFVAVAWSPSLGGAA